MITDYALRRLESRTALWQAMNRTATESQTSCSNFYVYGKPPPR
jgi:hypothetical protein